MNEDARLRELAQSAGLATRHCEIGGALREVPPATLRAVLEALGVLRPGQAPAEALAAFVERQARSLAPPVAASFEPDPPRLPLARGFAAGEGLDWSLQGEGRRESGGCADVDRGPQGPVLRLPDLEPGYYVVSLHSGGVAAEALLIRAPARAWCAPEPERAYGFSLQLYEQLGPDSVGVGDLGDLGALGEAAGRMGAAVLGVNPLHALSLTAPGRASPYSPSSRLALNPLYLDLNRLPGSVAPTPAEEPAVRARVAALNAGDRIDYAATAREKLARARAAWARFRAGGSDPAFARFLEHAPRGVAAWAEFETIAAEHGPDCFAWPAALRSRDAEAVRDFLAGREERYHFHLWLQWQADLQLGRAAEQARSGGLAIGLYHDLALGADPAGAEIWADREGFVAGVSVGAPPDPLNPRGQNWGFPPPHPRRLLERRLEPFIELVRSNMRHAGALRIDHVLGLNRLFVVPQGAAPADGAYLAYPLDALLAVVVLESRRAHCMVVGEDLGTVPAGLRERLAERGVLSLRLLYFERGRTGQPLPPEEYPRDALASIGTHDVAPFAGYWRGDDLTRTDRLGLWPSEEARAAAHAARPDEVAMLREAFSRAQLAEAGAEPPTVAAYRWLARTPCRLLAVQPEDALEISAPVNVPGTLDEEPNWCRRRLPPWPEWLADPRLLAVVRAIQEERGGPAARPRPCPTATYRIQLRPDSGFVQAAALAPYLAGLGVSHLYASPMLRAVPGSLHGYDVVDPERIDEGRGGEEGFRRLCAALRDSGLGLVADFVPNHMAAHPANAWWMDLLEWGRSSRHAATFDVDWSEADGRIVLPVLAVPAAEVFGRAEVAVEFELEGRFCARYREHRLPLAPESAAVLVALAGRAPGPAGDGRLQRLARRLQGLGAVGDDSRRARGLRLQAELATLAREPELHRALGAAALRAATDPGFMRRLLARQVWQLSYWRQGLEEINYRRFFDVADLAALRMERPAVFAAVHAGVRRLVAGAEVHGLRIDHIDGLALPGRYLEVLLALAAVHGGGVRIWVEKILAAGESLCAWPVAGTTGYEFLNQVTRLFIPEAGAERLRALWRSIAPEAGNFDETVRRAKRETVEVLLLPSLERVVRALAGRAPVEAERVRQAVSEFLAALPVYRAYPDAPAGCRAAQEAAIAAGVAGVSDAEAGDWLGRLLALPLDEEARLPAALRDGVARLWQLAAAATAKGVEDTAFYRDIALLALNEVGGDPRVASITSEEFHAQMRVRAHHWPDALNPGATHDTKRGEDARLRLAMLPGCAGAWGALVGELRAAEPPSGADSPHPADAYLVWQTLLAAWPPPVAPLAGHEQAALGERVAGYLVKAVREGKQRSSWLAPDEPYERTLVEYAAALLDPVRGAAFQRAFLPFARRVARCGALASLAALALRCTAPGVPDVYQGCELWDLSLVDPDNRRPVDYGAREQRRAALERASAGCADAEPPRSLLATWPTGDVKLWLLMRLLALRRQWPDTFSAGGYRPLELVGARRGDVLAFARGTGAAEVVVAVARVHPGLASEEECAVEAGVWGDTRVVIGEAAERRSWFDGRRHEAGELAVADLLAPLPAAVLVRQEA